MKFLLLVTVFFSMNVFAQEKLGYVCVGKTNSENAKLIKLAPKLGNDYLASIGIVTIRPETCSDVHAMIYADICKAGPFIVTIGLNNDGVLKVTKTKLVNLICEKEVIVGGHPSMGGSN